MEKSRSRAGLDRISFVVLFIFMILVSIVLTAAALLNNLNVGVCTASMPCQAYLTGLSDLVTPVVALVTFVGVLMVGRRSRENQKPTWWVPTVGIFAVILAFYLSTLLNAAGVNVSPFRT